MRVLGPDGVRPYEQRLRGASYSFSSDLNPLRLGFGNKGLGLRNLQHVTA